MLNTAFRGTRNKIGVGLLAAAFSFLVVAITAALWPEGKSEAQPDDARQVTRGKAAYARHCAACHGTNLEGQTNWRDKLPSGRMPAPPHDASGHTWHHPDAVLFGITKRGLVPGKYAPSSYRSDMPAFGSALSDGEIWAVLAYVKSTWPEKIRSAQADMTRKARQR
ncbi:MAG: c-type cytochrome [Betaproteobacteria bacterium]|nr:c-type cytochrome [Betaproteobacteria bacterium]